MIDFGGNKADTPKGNFLLPPLYMTIPGSSLIVGIKSQAPYRVR
jgi:hypothetical protein